MMILANILSSERRMSRVTTLVFLPWVAVIFFTAGPWAALTFVAYAIVVCSVGYGIVWLALPILSRTQTQTILLAPATGILVISALTAFWLRLGLPFNWVPTLWFAPLLKGAAGYGGALVVLSMLICAVYFLPGARNDAVVRRDGSFNWIYVDTQYFHSMAASVKSVDSPPKIPGTATAELLYHFGPYAPAAVISRITGLNLGDALARVTSGTELWSLVLSCFGLGTLLSLKATGERFGGIMSVAGLFFYGSLLSLFTDELNSASPVTGAILFKISDIGVLADGGPFSHLILGASVLHGLVAITAIVGLCIASTEQGTILGRRGLTLLTLPAFAVAVHSVAALYCLGVMGILLFWRHLDKVRSWAAIMLMLCLFLGTWKIMGYGHGPDAQVKINHDAFQLWWMLTVWFVIGLGFRIVGFRWISQPFKDPLSAVVLVSVLGLLFFSIVLDLELGAERYGIYFLQSIFSIFAFSRLPAGFWRSSERSQWVADWVRFAKRGLLPLVIAGVLIRFVLYKTHNQSWTVSFRRQIFPAFLLLVLLIGISAMMKRSGRLSTLSSGVVMAVLMVGFLAWITPWLNFGMGRMKMEITLAPGEVRGLKHLGELSKPQERFATNKHVADNLVGLRERSYAYGTLSERPVLLEGYGYRGESEAPGFDALLHDNDLMFSTKDPETVHSIAKTWGVRWLVARPGTDIALAKPLPSWMIEESDCGDLKVYRIN
jgi:hypothetical protein